MKPLFSIVVTLCLVVAATAHPENIEDVKQLPQTKEPIVEAEESQNHPRIERCSACSAKLNLNNQNAGYQVQSGETHSTQSFDSCSSENGCAGVKVKDGKIVEKYGNLEAFNAAAASNLATEYQFHAASALKNVFDKGIPSDGPFWWMNQNSPFKTSGGFQKYTSKSSYTSSSNGGLTDNIFLNGQLSKGSGFSSSSGFNSGSSGFNSGASGFNSGSSGFASGNAGSLAENPFLNGQISSGSGFNGYTGSSPRPFSASTAGSNINLIQTSQKGYSQGSNIDDVFASSGNVQPNENAGDLQQTCAGQGYVCVPRSQCNNGVVNTNGGYTPQASSQKQYCNIGTEICCRLETSGGFGVASSSFGTNSVSNFQNSAFGSSNIDTLTAGSGISETYRPGASGSNLKPGIPYLPPVDSTNSASNIVSSTPFPTPTFVTTSRPFSTIRPSTSGYLPPPTSTSAPGYLPPEKPESTNTKETYVPPSPDYTSGELILDDFRRPSSPRPTIPQAPSEVPSGCAAALKCTPIEFCTAEGVMSNTSVVLTRDQAAYRVPLTDCKDVETGRIGKCCRDPYYTDPWPVNQLGKWVPGAFGNDGKYVPDSRGSSSDISRPSVTVRPPTTGSIFLNVNRQSPTPITPTRFPVTTPTPTYQSTPGSGAYTQNGKGSYLQGGKGQYTVEGEGSYTQQGVGQFGVGGVGIQKFQGAGQVGIGQQSTFGAGQQGTFGAGQQGTFGAGQQGTFGAGQQGTFGAGQQGTFGAGQQGTFGAGQQGTFGAGKQTTVGVGQQGTFGVGQQATVGVGQQSTFGVGQQGTFGIGQQSAGGRGDLSSGGFGVQDSVGQGSFGGFGTAVGKGQFGVGTQGTYEQGVGVIKGQGTQVTTGSGQIGIVGQGIGATYDQGEITKYGQGFAQRQKEGVITQQGVGQGVIQGIGTGVKTGQGVQYSTGGGYGVENEALESVHRVFLQRYNGGGQCGLLNPLKPYGNKNDLEVDFAEIPWQAMVLLQTNKSLLCGGVITRPDVVITSAACVDGLEAKNVLIKGGEWKLGIDDEPLPFQIVQVKHILRHPFYKQGSYQYDAAILVLTENLRLAKNIYPICLPSQDNNLEAFYNGAGECLVTGWGKSVLQSHLQGSIMHALNVSLLNPGECQAKLSSDYPHLLEYYNTDSCVCGQPTNPLNNICKVDIGSALACTTGDNHFVLRGVYSWDSGCQIGNQIAAFYKFDIEWYEWALGFVESVRFARFGVGTKVTQTKITTKVTGVNTIYTSGVKGYGVTGGSTTTGVKGFGVSGSSGIGGVSSGSTTTNVKGFGNEVSGALIGVSGGGVQSNGFTSSVSSGGSYTKEITGGAGIAGIKGFGVTGVSGIGGVSGGSTTTNVKGFGNEVSGGGVQSNGFTGSISSGGSYTKEITGGAGITGIKGFGITGQNQFGQGGQFTSQFGQTSTQFGKTGQLNGEANLSGLNFGSGVKGPISNTYTATYTEKKVFQSEPKYVTYTTKPEIVTFTTKPEYYTFTTKPKFVTYTTKPEIITYTTKPEIVTFTTKPKIVTYTTKPQLITYETSGSGTNPQYVAPNVSFNPSFAEITGHKHTGQCKCLENSGKK